MSYKMKMVKYLERTLGYAKINKKDALSLPTTPENQVNSSYWRGQVQAIEQILKTASMMVDLD